MGLEVIRNPNRVSTFSKAPTKRKKTSSRASSGNSSSVAAAAERFARGFSGGGSARSLGSGSAGLSSLSASPSGRDSGLYGPGHQYGGPTSPVGGPQRAADFGLSLGRQAGNTYTPMTSFLDASIGKGGGLSKPDYGIADLFGGGGGGGQTADTSGAGSVSVADLLASLQPKAVDIGPAPTKAGVAGPAHYTPSLVDIASLIAPYGKARNDAVTQFANNKKQIETLGKGEQKDVQLQNKLEEANQKRLAADYAQQDAELHAHLSGLAKLGAGDIAGQGFTDPSVTAPIHAAADAETRSGDAQSKAGQRLIAGQSAEAQLDAHRQGVDAQAGTNAAQQQLSGNLSDIANALNLQEASAKAQGERQNAQSRTEAEQMNAKEQQQYMQNVMNANTQFQDASARYAQAQSGQSADLQKWRQNALAGLASSDAFVHPYQAKVQAELADRLSNNPKDDHARILGNVFSASDNENDARKYLETALDREGKTVTPWYYDLIHKYYAADTSKVSREGARAFKQFNG